MKLITDYRGEVEFSQDDIIHFEEPVHGFNDEDKYLLIANAEPELPFYWLQAVDKKDYVLVLTDPFLFIENYDFEIDEWSLEQLEITDISDLVVYNAVIIPEKIEEMTVNLRAPFIINVKNRKAKQLILDEKYPLKQRIAHEEA